MRSRAPQGPSYPVWLLMLAAVSVVPGLARAQAPVMAPAVAPAPTTPEETTMRAASTVLDEIMAVPGRSIPVSMLADAEGVAVIPNVIKGGFIVGARYGNGVLVIKENGQWRAPVFITLAGGNVGWQIGVQSTDVILVFKTQRSVQGILSGTFTLGVDAAAAAGPVGRQAAAATDPALKSEIFSYSRSRGIFAGVSLDGSALTIKQASNLAFYQQPAYAASGTIPPSAQVLIDKVIAYSQPRPAATAQTTVSPVAMSPNPQLQGNDVETVRAQTAQSATQLYQLVGPEWQSYLALPPEIFSGRTAPAPAAVDQALARFAAITTDPRYRTLAEQPQFQSTYGLLRQYAQVSRQPTAPVALPSPPTGSNY